MNNHRFKHSFQTGQVEIYIFSLCLLLLSSTGYAALFPEIVSQSSFCLPRVECVKSFPEDGPSIFLLNCSPHAKFTYDAEAFRDQVTSTSFLTRHQVNLKIAGLLNEHPSKFVDSKQSSAIRKLENYHVNKSGFNALDIPEFITFSALIKEQSPVNNVDVDLVNKIEPSDIYASKYYPQKIKYTVARRMLHLEARVDLPTLIEHQHEQLQLIVFIDSNPITIDQNTWASELKQTTINGAGLGINWTDKDHFSLQVYFASELEDQVLAIQPVLENLFWTQAVKYF